MAGSWTNAVRRWGEGDDAAQFELERVMRPFFLLLLGQIRREIPHRLRARIQSEGVVLHAFKAFLSGVRKNYFPQLTNREDMKRVFSWLVQCALTDAVRWHTRQKRNPSREVPVEELEQSSPTRIDSDHDFAEWLHEATVSMRGVHPKAIEIMELVMRGFTNTEVAQRLGLGLRNLQKIRKRMAEAWHDSQNADD